MPVKSQEKSVLLITLQAVETYTLFGDSDPLEGMVLGNGEIILLQYAEVVEFNQPAHQVLRTIRRRTSIPSNKENPLRPGDHRNERSRQGYTCPLDAATRQEDEVPIASCDYNVAEALDVDVLPQGFSGRRAAGSHPHNGSARAKFVCPVGATGPGAIRLVYDMCRMRRVGLAGVDGATLSETRHVVSEVVSEVVRPSHGHIVKLDVDDMVGDEVSYFDDPYQVVCYANPCQCSNKAYTEKNNPTVSRCSSESHQVEMILVLGLRSPPP